MIKVEVEGFRHKLSNFRKKYDEISMAGDNWFIKFLSQEYPELLPYYARGAIKYKNLIEPPNKLFEKDRFVWFIYRDWKKTEDSNSFFFHERNKDYVLYRIYEETRVVSVVMIMFDKSYIEMYEDKTLNDALEVI